MAAKLILLCGPSGSGKKTIWSGIINRPKYNAIFSVSMTTRKARKGEKHGDDYFFVTKKQFETAIKKKQFLEHATYIDNYYGTPKAFVIDNLKKNRNVFLEIEMNGALQIMKNFSNKKKMFSIFICPPSITELRKRLMKRHTENKEVIDKRIKQAKWEISKKKMFDYVIINKDVKVSRKQLREILDKELD